MTHVAENTAGKKWVGLAKFLTIMGCIAINATIIIAGIVDVSGILSKFFNVPQIWFKLAIVSTAIILTIVCLEPEKMKPIGYLTGGLIITIGRLDWQAFIMVTDNCRMILDGNEQYADATVDLFSFKGSGLFLGIAGYAFEAVATIFTGRQV